jgi:hypothetical protein
MPAKIVSIQYYEQKSYLCIGLKNGTVIIAHLSVAKTANLKASAEPQSLEFKQLQQQTKVVCFYERE